MRILVIGASGGTGREVVVRALGHGQTVTAFDRVPSAFAPTAGLTVVTGDVTDAVAVTRAVGGQDAVIVALGSRGERPVHVFSDGVANTVRAMTAGGIGRLVVMSAAGAGWRTGAVLPLVLRLRLLLPGMRGLLDDIERMEGDVMLSDLDWTLVRVPRLTDGEQVGDYRVADGTAVAGGTRLARADAAAVLLKCAETDLYSRRAVAAAY
jgi:putative NADH-flavin reductase